MTEDSTAGGEPPEESPGPLLPDALVEALHGAERILVVTHDNPDPDALASGCVLRAILEELMEVEVTVGYGGLVGRAENRAMIRELELPVTHLDPLDWSDFDAVAVVDTQPGFGNNSLPEDLVPEVVIDHHGTRGQTDGVALLDIRKDYGATSTILAEYASACGVRLPRHLVTALFYAIKSETQELGREASEPDRRQYLKLFPYADKPALANIQSARVPREYFRAFQLAIENARVYGRTVLTDLGRIDNPDLVAEIADFLLRLEGADWACCVAQNGDDLVLSLRTSEPDAHAGGVIRRVVAGLGSAGGHGAMAGGRVALQERDYADTLEMVRTRLLESLGSHRKPGESLVL